MKTTINAITACLVATIAMSASAENSDFRASIQDQSKINGIGQENLAVLVRVDQKDNETTRNNVLAKLKSKKTLPANATQSLNNDETNASAKGDGWTLQVSGKGNWIRFRDMKALDKGSASPLAMNQAPNAATLEQQGRDAIAANLSELVQLGTGESLELWYTALEVRGGQSASGTRQETIHNAKVVFTRAVDGIAVLGNGSKITVFLSTAGAMVGFDVDWSSIKKSGTNRKTAQLDKIVSRIDDLQSVAEMTDGEYDDTMECGYYDMGARNDSSGSIEPACLVTRIPTTNDGIPLVVAVPAAEDVPSNVLWPEASTLQTMAK